MEATEERSKSRNPLPWILVGAIVAPIIMLLFSYFKAGSEMREASILLLVPVAGAVAGWVVYAINPLGRPRGWRKPILLFLSLLVYIMSVIFGWAISQIGSF